MIQYTLKCDAGHSFDSWFKSSSAFDSLKNAGHLSCAICGSDEVRKAIMSPNLAKAPRPDLPANSGEVVSAPSTSTASQSSAMSMATAAGVAMQKAFQELKQQVEQNSDYVGTRFADEARAMHLGDVPERPIYGEANAAQAKALIEDGVPVMPLPFKPTKQTN